MGLMARASGRGGDHMDRSASSSNLRSGRDAGGIPANAPTAQRALLSRVFSRRRSLRSILRRPSELQLARATRQTRRTGTGGGGGGGGGGRRLRFADEVDVTDSTRSSIPNFVEVIDVPYTETRLHRLWRTRKIEIGFVFIGVGLLISTVVIVVAIVLGLTDDSAQPFE